MWTLFYFTKTSSGVTFAPESEARIRQNSLGDCFVASAETGSRTLSQFVTERSKLA